LVFGVAICPDSCDKCRCSVRRTNVEVDANGRYLRTIWHRTQIANLHAGCRASERCNGPISYFVLIKSPHCRHQCSSASSVPRRLLRASLPSFRPPTSAFGQPSQTEYSAISSQHSWQMRAFSVAGPTVWNSMPDSLRDPAVESERLSAGLENASLCRRTLEA